MSALMAERKRPCPTCRKKMMQREGDRYLYCDTCGWTDDPEDRKKIYGAKP